MLTLSRAEAWRLLAIYRFTPTDGPGVFERLGMVQYDPLNLVGRNSDLALQALMSTAIRLMTGNGESTPADLFTTHGIIACLVPMSDWPLHAWLHTYTYNLHLLLVEEQADAVTAALAELDARVPFSSHWNLKINRTSPTGAVDTVPSASNTFCGCHGIAS